MIIPGDIVFFIRNNVAYRCAILFVPKNHNNNVVMVPLPAQRLDACALLKVSMVSKSTRESYQEEMPFLFDEAHDRFSEHKIESLIADDDTYPNIYLGKSYISDESMKVVTAEACTSGMPDDFKRIIGCRA